jgi:putative nucleotidyltransferase with HDIG domain
MREVESFVRQKLAEFFVEEHVVKVVENALWLCEFYPDADRDLVETAAWLHDIGHIRFGREYYEKQDAEEGGHHLRGVKMARGFLESQHFAKDKMEAVLHCIESHRTREPPDPETIEARIVASADNLTHFDTFDKLVERMGFDFAFKKIQRDIRSDFMLPEAIDYAKKKMAEIERRYVDEKRSY